MCGIVAFFGDAGNSLTRVLTAMSAITYRAPDSTGVGLFGDDSEPIRTRKALGSVAPLVETLLEQPAYPDSATWLRSLWMDGTPAPEDVQRRLLLFEGLPVETLDALNEDGGTYPSFEDLVDPEHPVMIEPGQPGRPETSREFRIRSRKQFQRIILELTCEHDLSPLVVRTLMRKALSDSMEEDVRSGALSAQPFEILSAFDRLFDTASREERSPRPQRLYQDAFPGAPYAEKYLWQYLVRTPFRVPLDYDRDGVRCLFRLLDAALLCRVPCTPGLEEAVQSTLESLWPEAVSFREKGGWRTLYTAEKGANLYGRAASAALVHLQSNEILPDVSSAEISTSHPVPTCDGRTDPFSLRSLATPLLSQGRWALQSPVTLKNAHPFFDHLRRRIIVLNGQFSGDVEENLRTFLETVAGYRFRSRNSSEYFSLLWGYYFDVFRGEKGRYEAILSQVDQHLEGFGIGSRSIDYEIFRLLQDKSPRELDAIAFVEAARCIARDGGQIAVSGVSLFSPRVLYVACHNRPVFIVHRVGSQDYMVVSDINAAMGLFPQRVIHEKAIELHRLWKRCQEEAAALRADGAGREMLQALKVRRQQEEERILETFLVRVFPLDGEEMFARIETVPSPGGATRNLTMSRFDGSPLPSVEPFSARLNPLETGKDIHRSFYESHLLETPERFENILNFHGCEEEEGPEFDLKESLLRRRFGRNLTSLSRIVLMGMGSAHHAGIMTRRIIQKAIPGVDAVSLRPAELEDIKKSIIPENDLVLLLSWSGTTADMVRTANELTSMKATIIGVTEKVFSDVGLITGRSAGVIPVLSGEEVTVQGLKSILCMMFSVALFSIWLSSRFRPEVDTRELLEGLRSLPDRISGVLQDEGAERFCRSLAEEARQSRCALIIDALYSTGTGREAAFKLEETSWNTIGRPLDYREAAEGLPAIRADRDLILLDATNEARISEAMDTARQLSRERIPFAAVGLAGRHQAELERATGGRFFALPRVNEELQPFIDLVFYYLLAFHYGIAHGRSTEDFPRNRAKSVTAGRSPIRGDLTPASEILELKTWGNDLPEPSIDGSDLGAESLWEQRSESSGDRAYYAAMRSLAQALLAGGGPGSVLHTSGVRIPSMAEALFEKAPEEGEMILVPLDRAAHSTARTLAVHWSRLLGCAVRVATVEDREFHSPEDKVTFFLATRQPDFETLSPLLRDDSFPFLYCGPDFGGDPAWAREPSLGLCRIRSKYRPCAEEALYAGLFLLFIEAWKRVHPDRSETAERTFRYCGGAIHAILNSDALLEETARAVHENRAYETAFFIGPPGGTGTSWVHRFDGIPSPVMVSYLFGESVHGPLVTVDSRVREKFVRIEARARMEEDHGEGVVAGWESGYLGGRSVDDFLADPPRDVPLHPKSPFYAEGNWFLPVLRPGYDTGNDNLIIMDATSDRFLGTHPRRDGDLRLPPRPDHPHHPACPGVPARTQGPLPVSRGSRHPPALPVDRRARKAGAGSCPSPGPESPLLRHGLLFQILRR